MKRFLAYCSIVCIVLFSTLDAAQPIATENTVNNTNGWLPDGTPGIQTEGNIFVNLQKKSTGSPQNGLWKQGGGLTSGSRYWTIRFNLVTDHASVGVTSNDKFGQGWKTKGLYYNGNLSNGGALLVGDFGKRLKTGDVVGLLVSIEDGKVRVYYDINKKPLGLAFEVNSDLFDGPLFPSVSLDGSGVVTISEVIPAPPPQPRPKPTEAGTITGNWKLDTDTLKCESALPIPPPFRRGPIATLKVVDSPTSQAPTHVYDVLLRVVNNITFRWTNKEGTNQWTTSPQMSTRMMGPPENMAIERCLSDLSNNPTEIVVTTEDKLRIQKVSLSATWIRYDAAPQPFTGNPFN